MRRKWLMYGMAAFLLVPALTYSQGLRSVGKNIESILQQILEDQSSMQKQIDDLRYRLDEKDRQIADLKTLVNQQKSVIETQEQTLASRPAAGGGTDFYSARVQYDAARSLQHDVIFNIRKGEQPAYFDRVIQEFRKVVTQFPDAPEADDSQIRIARTYHRYMDNTEQAAVEYQALLDHYPDSEYAEEAQKALAALKK